LLPTFSIEAVSLPAPAATSDNDELRGEFPTRNGKRHPLCQEHASALLGALAGEQGLARASDPGSAAVGLILDSKQVISKNTLATLPSIKPQRKPVIMSFDSHHHSFLIVRQAS
jgi:hypothetical protein